MACWRRVARAPIAGLLGLTLCGVASAQTRSPGPALPTSPVIREIEWAPRDTIVRKAKGGDNWPVTWTTNVNHRAPVVRRAGACLRSAMTYNAGLGRYLWWQQIPRPIDTADRGDTRFEGGFVILDAAEPWGPWTVAYHTDRWDVGPGEHADFPTKWISRDGCTVYLVFSGDDCSCVRRAQIHLRQSDDNRSSD